MTRLNRFERDLQKTLVQWSGMIRHIGYWGGYTYHGIEDFVLKNGVWHKVKPMPWGVPRGMPRACFGNAIVLAALHGWKYIEGFATGQGVLHIPIHHAWNVDDEGRLVDNTWLNLGRAYLGVEFSVDRAQYAANYDNATVLDNPHQHNILYKDPWPGEDYSIKWRISPALKGVLGGHTRRKHAR